MAGVAMMASSASATLTDPFIRVTATNASGTGTFTVPLADVTINPNGSAIWILPAPVDVMDGPTVIARLTQMTGFVRPTIGALPNLISLGFTFTAGSSATTFTVDSTVFGINPITDEAGRASGGVTVTDRNSDGVTLTGASPNGFAYRTAYNGAAPGGTQFADLIQGVSAGPAGSNTVNMSSPGGGLYTPIGDVTDMSSRWQFVLTANDQVGATSVWEVIPAPGTVSLLALGGLVAARRRNRN